MVTFAQKFRYFTDQSGRKGEQHKNEYLSILSIFKFRNEWYKQLDRKK